MKGKLKIYKLACFVLITLLLGSCGKDTKRTFLRIPTINGKQIKGLSTAPYVKVFAYWGKKVDDKEIKEALTGARWSSQLEKLSHDKGMVYYPLFCDLKTIKKLINKKIPVIEFGFKDFASANGIIYVMSGPFLIYGYNESAHLLYLEYPSDILNRVEKAVYPEEVFILNCWAGREEGEALLIVPRELKETVLKMVSSEAVKRGRDLFSLYESENISVINGESSHINRTTTFESLMEARKNLLKQYPNWAYAYYLFGYPLFMATREVDGLKLLEKACELEPSPFYHLRLASAYTTLGNYQKALKKIDDFYKATKNKSTVSSVFLLTYIYSKMGMFQHAEDILLTLLKNIPNNNPLKREINFIRALLKFEQGKPDEAIYILREIVEKYNFDYYFYDYKLLFAIYLHLKKYQQAHRLLYEVKEKFGNKEGYKEVLSVWEETIKYKLVKNPQEKVRILRQLGKFVKVSDELLLFYLENRMWEEAEKLLKLDRDFDIDKWINTSPTLIFFGPPQTRMEAARILAANGVIAYHKGNKKKAREFFQRAIRYAEEPLTLFTPLNAEAILTPRAYLGMIFYEEGKEELARKYLKEAFSKKVPFLGDDEAKPVARKLGISVR